MLDRKQAFDAIGAIYPDVWNVAGNIAAMDAIIDRWEARQVKAPDTLRRKINQEGRELIQSFEGLKLSVYRCPAGVPTIGYGSTGPHVMMGMPPITRAEAEAMFDQDLRRFEDCVARNCPHATENQFAAMVSLAFNIGCAAFERSTVLKRHKAGSHKLAQAAFLLWVKAGGKTLAGLVRRRKAEATLYGKA